MPQDQALKHSATNIGRIRIYTNNSLFPDTKAWFNPIRHLTPNTHGFDF